jgi:hypothetical protein
MECDSIQFGGQPTSSSEELLTSVFRVEYVKSCKKDGT